MKKNFPMPFDISQFMYGEVGWDMLDQAGKVSFTSGLLVLRIPGSMISLPVRGSI